MAVKALLPSLIVVAIIGLAAIATASNGDRGLWLGLLRAWLNGQDQDDDGPRNLRRAPYHSPSETDGQSGASYFGPGNNYYSGSPDSVHTGLDYRNIHGVLATIAFAFVFPLGAILLRTGQLHDNAPATASPTTLASRRRGRHTRKSWGRYAWIVHAATQLLAYAMFIAAAGLGIYLALSIRVPQPAGSESEYRFSYSRPLDFQNLLSTARANAHPIVGLVVLALLAVQPVLGLVHHVRFKRPGGDGGGRRTWVSHAHIWIGRLGTLLGVVNGGLGFWLVGRDPISGCVVAYVAVAAVMWIFWIAQAARWGSARRETKRLGRRTGNPSCGNYGRGNWDTGSNQQTPLSMIGDDDPITTPAPCAMRGRSSPSNRPSNGNGSGNSRNEGVRRATTKTAASSNGNGGRNISAFASIFLGRPCPPTYAHFDASMLLAPYEQELLSRVSGYGNHAEEQPEPGSRSKPAGEDFEMTAMPSRVPSR